MDVYSFQFLNRKNEAEMNKKIKVEYEGGSQDFDLEKIYQIRSFHFTKMITTSWIKITVTEVYGEINNGGAFKFWGKFNQ